MSRKAGTERDYTKASAVVITRADGTQTVEPPLTRAQMMKVVRQGQAAPRTWSEAFTTHGGGNDFKT